jgi:hypothetical protein
MTPQDLRSSMPIFKVIESCKPACAGVGGTKYTYLSTVIVSLLICFLTGCTTRAKAKQEARAAYIAGREQAERMMQSRMNVTVQGAVRNPLVPWSDDLTLAKALVFADYSGNGTPQEIILVRNGVAQRIDPNELLAGKDMPLLLGDIVQIR